MEVHWLTSFMVTPRMVTRSSANSQTNCLRRYVPLDCLHARCSCDVQVSKPFFATLHKWLFSGELHDPFSEFFVAVDPELAHLQYMQPSLQGVGQLASDGGFGGGDVEDPSEERAGGLQLWEQKDRKSTRLNSSHSGESRMPSSA